MSLIDIEDYKEYLQIEDNDYNSALITMIGEVENKVEGRLKRSLASQEYIEIYDGNGRNVLIPDNYPITAITKLEVYEGLDSSNNEIWTQYVKGTHYNRLMIKDDISIYMDCATFPKGMQNIRLTYTAGYADIPYQIQRICKELLKIYWDSSNYGKNTLGLKSKTFETNGGTDTIVYDSEIENKILSKLDSYVINI